MLGNMPLRSGGSAENWIYSEDSGCTKFKATDPEPFTVGSSSPRQPSQSLDFSGAGLGEQRVLYGAVHQQVHQSTHQASAKPYVPAHKVNTLLVFYHPTIIATFLSLRKECGVADFPNDFCSSQIQCLSSTISQSVVHIVSMSSLAPHVTQKRISIATWRCKLLQVLLSSTPQVLKYMLRHSFLDCSFFGLRFC